MADKKNDNSKKLHKEHSFIIDLLSKITGDSMKAAYKELFFKRAMIDHQMKYYVALNDDPIAEMMIEKLNKEKVMIDIEEYKTMLNKTHKAVKEEAEKATKEGIQEALNQILN